MRRQQKHINETHYTSSAYKSSACKLIRTGRVLKHEGEYVLRDLT